MQPISAALDHDLAEIPSCGPFQTGEHGQWEPNHGSIVQINDHTPRSAVVASGHGEELAFYPLRRPPRERVEFL